MAVNLRVRSSGVILARRCAHCGDTFTPAPSRPLQRFCRPSCRLAHFKVNREPRLPFDDVDSLFAEPFEE